LIALHLLSPIIVYKILDVSYWKVFEAPRDQFCAGADQDFAFGQCFVDNEFDHSSDFFALAKTFGPEAYLDGIWFFLVGLLGRFYVGVLEVKVGVVEE
jgi:hypothetical protein